MNDEIKTLKEKIACIETEEIWQPRLYAKCYYNGYIICSELV